MKGDAVLEVLVALTTREETDPAFSPAAHPRRIAQAIDPEARDGRAASAPLRRLVEVGLATRGQRARRLASGRIKTYTGSGNTVYSPTVRGIEVDRLLAGATAKRGGTFTPKNQLGLTTREMLALR